MTPLILAWPPTVNTYWRNVQGRVLISKRGREYRRHVAEQVLIQVRGRRFTDQRLALRVDCYPPDRRKRDLDNLAKGVLDSLAKAGLYNDDSQIDDLRLVRARRPSDRGGHIVVTIEEMNP